MHQLVQISGCAVKPAPSLPQDLQVADSPILKRFRTKNNCYVYDVNTGLILKVDHVAYDVLEYFGFLPADEIAARLAHAHEIALVERAIAQLESLRARFGAFKAVRVKSRMVSPAFVEDKWQEMVGGFHQLTLSVTEQCNLRCSYCAYSGGYANTRVHNHFQMEWETAQKAIDFFLADLGSQLLDHELSFYGGEPLTNMGLVKRCIEYVKEKNPAIQFGMTTNATLLAGETREYLVSNRVRLLISVDGPAEIHDKDRVFISGKGSFDKILKNLRELKKIYAEYYDQQVSFWCTTTPTSDVKGILKFFVENPDLFSEHAVRFGAVVSGHKTYFNSPQNPDAVSGYEWLEKHFRRKVVRGETNDREFTMMRSLLEKPYSKLHRRRINLDGWGEDFHHMTACFPGSYRLFVKADGTFQICEKSNDSLGIGNVDTGLDGEKICGIFRKYHNLHDTDCKKCWALHLCTNCYVSSTRETGRFQAALDSRFCTNQRRFWEDSLGGYAEILEKNPNAFQYLESMTEFGSKIPVIDFDPNQETSSAGTSPSV